MMRISLEKAFQMGGMPGGAFELDLDSAGILQAEALLRVLPGKRLVMRARQNDTALLVKIFREKHSYQKELKGYDVLYATGIATPKRLKHGELAQGAYCFYEYIENLQPFKQVIEQAPEKDKAQCLRELLTLLTVMYGGKVIQEDLHFDNFAYADGVLLALDPASCGVFHQQSKIQDNLSLLLAQLPLQEWLAALDEISRAFPELDKVQLARCGQARWEKRLQAFLKKIYRDCTYIKHWSFATTALQRLEIYGVRQYCSENMMRALQSITATSPVAEYLKRGESSLVYTIEVDGYKRVVKHSRNKTLGRLLRRCLRRSRASSAWYFSHMLLEAGILTPQPIALVERRLGPFVLESWFVSDYIEADTLLDVWCYEIPTKQQLDSIRTLFKTMEQLKISHGDLKATNLLCVDDGIFVIDFDGSIAHRKKEKAERALKKDKERFLRNWPEQKQEMIRHVL